MMRDERVTTLIEESKRLRYSRRTILKRASALGLSTAALGTVLAGTGQRALAAPSRAPALLQGTSMNILCATYFVPAAEEFYADQVAQWGQENSVDVTVDFINWPDLQPRTTAAVQAGSGPDIIEFWDTIPYLFSERLVPQADLAQQVSESQGGFYDWVTATASVDGEWYTIPHGNSTTAMAYRMSYFEQAGVSDPANNFPATWEEFFEVARVLKQEVGKPVGQALGQSLGDPPSFAYPYMWSYGAMEVDEEGNVAFNRPEFVDAMEMFMQAWTDGYDETGLGWDDTINNTAFAADEISATLNGSSIYLALLEPEADGGNPEMAADTNHTTLPAGPAGAFNVLGSRSFGVLDYSENVDGANAFLEWWFAPEQYLPWLEAYQGYLIPPGPEFADNEVFTSDPKLAAYAEVVNRARNKGFAGPANQQAAQVSLQSIIVNAYAEAINSGDAAGVIEQTAQQLERIYGG